MTARMALPVATLVLAVLLACGRWHAGPELALVAPFLPVVVVRHWAARAPQLLPEWAVALAGLCVDAVTQGPLGCWALVYLVAYGVGLVSRRFADGGLAERMLAASLGLIASGLACALVLALYSWSDFSARPVAAAVAAALALGAAVEMAARHGAYSGPRGA